MYLINQNSYFNNEDERRYKSLSLLVFYFKGILLKTKWNKNITRIHRFPNISVKNNDYNRNNYGMIPFKNLKDK